MHNFYVHFNYTDIKGFTKGSHGYGLNTKSIMATLLLSAQNSSTFSPSGIKAKQGPHQVAEKWSQITLFWKSDSLNMSDG